MISGIPRLGLPGTSLADSAVVRGAAERQARVGHAVAVHEQGPAWELGGVEYGKLIGRELRDQEYNVSLGGGVDITREPRNGRHFNTTASDRTGREDGGSAHPWARTGGT